MTLPTPTCLKGHPMKRDHRYTKADVWRCRECGTDLQTEPGLYRDPDAAPVVKTCACGCGETFTPSLRHPGQLYVATSHRMRAYRARRNAEDQEAVQ